MDRRTRFRQGLNDLYVRQYDALCLLLPDHWQPISGLRTMEKQAELYAQGRTAPGDIVTKAKPGLSYHNYGIATDWDYFPNGIYSPLESHNLLWKEYIDACEKVGLQCLKWEKPHNQLKIPVRIQKVYMVYIQKGMIAVNAYLRTVLSG